MLRLYNSPWSFRFRFLRRNLNGGLPVDSSFEEKVFESIVRDYGRIVLRTIKMPCNARLVVEILKDCERKRNDVEAAARRLVREVAKG